MAGLQDISPMVAKLVRDQRRARAHAGGRSRSLAAGMAAADNDHVEGRFAHRGLRLRRGTAKLVKATRNVKN